MAWPTSTKVPVVPPIVNFVWGPNALDSPVLEPVRRFNGSGGLTDRIVTAIGKCDQLEITMALLVRIPEAPAADAALMSITDGESGYILRINSSGQLEVESNIASTKTGEFPFSPNWQLILVSFSGGLENKPEFRVYDLEAEETTLSGSGNNVLSAAAGADRVAFGEDGAGEERGLEFDIAAAAVWDSVVGEPGDVTELVGVEALSDWLEIKVGVGEGTPVALWLFGQASTGYELVDLTGNGADETSSSGTKVLLESPPIPYGSAVIVEEGSKPPTTGQLFPRGMN